MPLFTQLMIIDQCVPDVNEALQESSHDIGLASDDLPTRHVLK